MRVELGYEMFACVELNGCEWKSLLYVNPCYYLRLTAHRSDVSTVAAIYRESIGTRVVRAPCYLSHCRNKRTDAAKVRGKLPARARFTCASLICDGARRARQTHANYPFYMIGEMGACAPPCRYSSFSLSRATRKCASRLRAAFECLYTSPLNA